VSLARGQALQWWRRPGKRQGIVPRDNAGGCAGGRESVLEPRHLGKVHRVNTAKFERYYEERLLTPALPAWYSVVDKDYLELIRHFNFAQIFRELGEKNEGDIRALDVGCGAGRFPDLLLRSFDAQNPPVNLGSIVYDYLDLSDFCLRELPRALRPPVRPGLAVRGNIDTLDPASLRAPYDLIWCLHSLYSIRHASLGETLGKLASLLTKNGVCLIYQLASGSFYDRVARMYEKEFGKGNGQTAPYNLAEELIDALLANHIPHEVFPFEFSHEVRASDHETLTKYLQKCVLDSDRSLDDWLAREPLRDFLASHLAGDIYRFPQRVWLIRIDAKARRAAVPLAPLRKHAS